MGIACILEVEVDISEVRVRKVNQVGKLKAYVTVTFDNQFDRYVIEKGSIAVEGVSLTVNSCQGHTFSVNIIPHTAQATTLEALKVGDRVNLETDIIGKYVVRLLGKEAPREAGVTAELLARQGFL